jgi:AcrR family transcriptional regulator
MTAALDLVRRHGYRRVRLEDIAAAAGVSKATVYHYFTNKDDLLTRAVATRMAGRHAEAEALLADAPPAAEARLRHLPAGTSGSCRSRPTRVCGSGCSSARSSPRLRRCSSVWAEGLVQRWHGVEQLIREGQASGEFRPDVDAEVAARMIVSGFRTRPSSTCTSTSNRIAPCDSDRLLSSALEQFFQSLAVRRPRSG